MEIDTYLSASYGQVFSTTTASVKLGLTATCEATSTVYKSKVSELLHGEVRQTDAATKAGIITDTINKGQMLEVVCPVVYSYSTSQAIEDGLVTPFKTYIVEHQLDAVKRNVKPWKTKTYMLSERAAYDQWNALRTSPTNVAAMVRKLCGNKMTRLLWEAESKIWVARALLSQLEGKTIVFGLSLKFVQRITPNTVIPNSKKDYVVMFNNGEITSIGTVKKLERGITLNGVDNIILVSWHSTATSFLQRLGRGLRPSPGKEHCNLYLFKTSNSYEAGRWFEKINKILDDKGNVIEEIDLNIQGYLSSNEILRNQK